MKSLKTFACLLALLTAVPAVRAGDFSVFNLGLGAQYWNARDVDNFDTDGMVGGNVIIRIRPIEYLGLDFRAGASGNWDGESYRDYDGTRYKSDVTFSCVPLEAGLVAMLPIGGVLTLYGGPGVGYYFYNLNIRERSSRHGHHQHTELDEDIDMENDFGWYAVLGATIKLCPHLAIFGEARYTDTETSFEDNDWDDEKIDCSGVGFQAGLMFDF
jgi:opacity protein-like surface antigen